MTELETHRTRSGSTLIDEEIGAIATEVEETDYGVEALRHTKGSLHRGEPAPSRVPRDPRHFRTVAATP